MVRRAPGPGSPLSLAGENALFFMEQHLRCLYGHDGEGRIHSTREPSSPRPPRFHLGRTPLGILWRFRDDLPASLLRSLSRLAAKEAALIGDWPRHGQPPPSPPERIDALRRLLREHGEIEFEWCGPVYRFPQETPEKTPEETPEEKGARAAARPDGSGGAPALVAVAAGDEELLERHFSDVREELSLRQPCVALVENGHAISLCCCARSADTSANAAGACRAAEARVETAPGHGGRGYATRTVAAWAQSVRAQGLLPLYSTTWENHASRSVARRLGLIPYGEDLRIA